MSSGFGTLSRSYFDPRAMAMNSMMSSMTAGMSGAGGMGSDPSDADVYQTVSEAFGNIAKASTAKLAPRK